MDGQPFILSHGYTTQSEPAGVTSTHWLLTTVHLQERRTMTFSTIPDTSLVNNRDLHQDVSRAGDAPQPCPHTLHAAAGDKAKARM
jgi:hypothetical protein